MIERFKQLAHLNTVRRIETLGFIQGKFSAQHRAVTATALLLPRQTGTAGTCKEVSIDPAQGDEPWLLKLAELQERE